MTKKLVAAPSPKGTNRAFYYVPADYAQPRGAAYDARRGLGFDAEPEQSRCAKIARDLVDALSEDELGELGREVMRARDAKYGARDNGAAYQPGDKPDWKEAGARDESTSASPYLSNKGPNYAQSIKREKNSGPGLAGLTGKRSAMASDAKWAGAMRAMVRPRVVAKSLERKMATDRAIASTLEQRLGVKLPTVNVECAQDTARVGTSGRVFDEAECAARLGIKAFPKAAI